MARTVDASAFGQLPWDQALRRWAVSYRETFAAHPGTIGMLAAEPVADPAVHAQYERAVTALEDAGFPRHTVLAVITATEKLRPGLRARPRRPARHCHRHRRRHHPPPRRGRRRHPLRTCPRRPGLPPRPGRPDHRPPPRAQPGSQRPVTPRLEASPRSSPTSRPASNHTGSPQARTGHLTPQTPLPGPGQRLDITSALRHIAPKQRCHIAGSGASNGSVTRVPTTKAKSRQKQVMARGDVAGGLPRRFSGYPTSRARVDTLRRPGVQRACGQPEGGWRNGGGGG